MWIGIKDHSTFKIAYLIEIQLKAESDSILNGPIRKKTIFIKRKI